MSYNYNIARLLLIFSTQYLMNNDATNRPASINIPNNFNNLIPSNTADKANGYVLIPKSYSESFAPETHANYNISDFVKNSSNGNVTYQDITNNDVHIQEQAIKDCITAMADFAVKIKNRCSYAGIWIGLPEININTYAKSELYSNMSALVKNARTELYTKVLMTYIYYCHKIFENKSIWNKVKGFYYNQEYVYDTTFNSNNVSASGEYRLMAAVSNCVHNSVFNYVSFDDLPTINKDLIWIPFTPAKASNDVVEGIDGETVMYNAYTKIGTLAKKCYIFDCAFLQSNLIDAFKRVEDVNDITITNYYNMCDNDSTIANIIRSGRKNISAIFHSTVVNNILRPDGQKVVENPNTTCKIGCEYELLGSKEQALIYAEENNTYPDSKSKSLFQYYKVYDYFADNKPLAFYWEATTTESFNKVCRDVEEAFNFNERFSPKDCTVYSSVDRLLNSLSGNILLAKATTLQNALSQPMTGTININMGTAFPEYNGETVAKTIRNIVLNDNPDKFWIKKLTYTTSYNNGNLSSISFYVEQKSSSDANNVITFNNKITEALNNMNITPNSNNGKTETRSASSDFNTFHTIYNWLISNVTLVESTNLYYNSAFGAIASTPKTATKKGFAEGLAVLCRAAGIPCLVIDGHKDGLIHHWNYIKIDNHWWFVDISFSMPTTSDPYKYKYFLREIPESYLSSSYLPEVNGENDNYILYGDVDEDGVITSNDAAYAQQKAILPSFNISAIAEIAADADGDGSITVSDASYIMQKVLVSTYELPVETKLKNVWI